MTPPLIGAVEPTRRKLARGVPWMTRRVPNLHHTMTRSFRTACTVVWWSAGGNSGTPTIRRQQTSLAGWTSVRAGKGRKAIVRSGQLRGRRVEEWESWFAWFSRGRTGLIEKWMSQFAASVSFDLPSGSVLHRRQ